MKKIIILSLVFALMLLFVGPTLADEVTGTLNSGLQSGFNGGVPTDPTASPASGYTSSVAFTVTLSASDATTIRYATGGSIPSCPAGGNLYAGSITISSSTTLRAIACYDTDSSVPSNVVAFSYTISGGSSSGGGGSSVTYCTAVTYGDWQTICFGDLQYRSVLTKTPIGCTLTSAQQAALQRACPTTATTTEETTGEITTGTGEGTTGGETPGGTAGTGENMGGPEFIAAEIALTTTTNQKLVNRLLGRILLQVEEHGEAWYVYPVDGHRYYLGSASYAFQIMRQLGLGISNNDYASFQKSGAPKRLSGRILLQVEEHGEAYYVNPLDLKMYYMGRPADAYNLMRTFGLGITDKDLHQIPVGVITE